MPPKDLPIPQIITDARNLLAQAAEALRSAEKTEASVRDRLALAERDHTRVQEHIGREIEKIVKKLDEDTLQFVRDTA